jgi:hypothetical protein
VSERGQGSLELGQPTSSIPFTVASEQFPFDVIVTQLFSSLCPSSVSAEDKPACVCMLRLSQSVNSWLPDYDVADLQRCSRSEFSMEAFDIIAIDHAPGFEKGWE